MSARERAAVTLADQLRDATVRLDEQRKMTDEADARAEKAERERDEARGDSPSGFWSQREWEDWSNELAGLIPEDDAAQYSNPEGAQESIIMDCFRAYRRERDEAREALARVEALRDEWKALGYGASVYESAAELGDLLSAALAGTDPTDTEGDDRD